MANRGFPWTFIKSRMIEKVEMVNGLVIYLVVCIWGAKKKTEQEQHWKTENYRLSPSSFFLIISASQSYNFIQIIFFLQPYNIIVTVEMHKETWDQFLDVGISIPSLSFMFVGFFFKAVQLFGLVCFYEND